MSNKYILGLFMTLAIPYLTVYALTPVVTAVDQGDGSSVQITTTNGDPNSNVTLYYTGSSDGNLRSLSLGTTDYQGYFRTTISTSNLAIRSNSATYVTINGFTSNSITWPTSAMSNGGLTLTPNTLTLGRNQSSSIQLTGGNAPYTLTSVSGDGITFSYTGNILTVSGTSDGTRVTRVCSSNNLCGTFSLTVSGSQGGSLSLSPSSITLNRSQSGTVQISGGNTPYTAYMMNGNTISTSISGSVLTLSGGSLGASTVNVCSSNGSCSVLSVNIGGSTQSQAVTYSFPIAISQSVNISLASGNSSTYYLLSGNTSHVTATVTNNLLTVTGTTFGTGVVTVCQTNSSVCMPFTFVVNQAAASTGGTGGPFTFNTDMSWGNTSTDVVELQKYLIGEKYLNTDATGYFGDYTLEAVQRFQSAHGVPATGYVGSLTRGVLNNN